MSQISSTTEVLTSLRVLLRCFVSILYERRIGPNYLQFDHSCFGVKITHDVNNNSLCVFKSEFGRAWIDVGVVFDLNDPRALAVAIRCACRLLREEVPTFDAIDEALREGPPEWVLQDEGLL